MKLHISEQIKYRIVGLVVILSIAVIFIPTLMKKSAQRFEQTMHVSLKLPKKPQEPRIVMPNERTLFKTVKIAKVNVLTPSVNRSKVASIIKAEPLRHLPEVVAVSAIEKVGLLPPAPEKATVIKQVVAARDKPPVKTPFVKPVAFKDDYYGVQLASFSQKNNAEALVSKLRRQGYRASLTDIKRGNSTIYKVVVGQLQQRQAAVNLQKKLAMNLRLQGFIVKTDIG